jgi:hypothetical protein
VEQLMEWFTNLDENVLRELDPLGTLINLVVVLVLGQVLAWHYMRFARVLSNKRKLASILMFLAATTMMVITVVKTSLALSLGLVGALSIIRFRTPIKEPEDLAYLFLAIAMGIGIGADERLTTALTFLGILAALVVARRGKAGSGPPRVFAHVNMPLRKTDGSLLSVEDGMRELTRRAGETSARVDVRRVDSDDSTLDATLILDLKSGGEIGALVSRIQDGFPAASVSVVEDSSFD